MCDDGWTGADCSYPLIELDESSHAVNYTLHYNDWIYFKVPHLTSEFVVVIKESGEGLVWVYSKKGEIPVLGDNWAYTDHSIHIVDLINHLTLTTRAADYYIGVYGSPWIINEPATFQIASHRFTN